MYATFHEMYLELANLQTMLNHGETGEYADKQAVEDRRANIIWQLKARGLDPDTEPKMLIPN